MVLPAPWTPFKPKKKGGGGSLLLAYFFRWASSRSRMKGMQCSDLSSIIWGMIGVIIDHYGDSLIMRRVFSQADNHKMNRICTSPIPPFSACLRLWHVKEASRALRLPQQSLPRHDDDLKLGHHGICNPALNKSIQPYTSRCFHLIPPSFSPLPHLNCHRCIYFLARCILSLFAL